MGAIVENYNIGDAAIRSVNAGSDIVLVCHGYENVTAVIEALINAAEDGTIPIERIDKSVYRILKLKDKYNVTDNITGSIDVEKINKDISLLLNLYLEE
jgi:beta-N-acetylhexosaminidase